MPAGGGQLWLIRWRRKGMVQCSTFFIREVVAFIIGDEVNHGAFAQSCWFIEYDAAFATRARRGLMCVIYGVDE